MRTFSTILKEVNNNSKAVSVHGSNEGLEIVYNKTEIAAGYPALDLQSLKSLGYNAVLTGRKWLKITITLEVSQKVNGNVWYN